MSFRGTSPQSRARHRGNGEEEERIEDTMCRDASSRDGIRVREKGGQHVWQDQQRG